MKRYTERPFPLYRHRPGKTPHPERDPEGHLYGKDEEPPVPIDRHRWRESSTYLYGVDLFNARFWWEAHVEWEKLWMAAPPGSPEALFVQSLIQLAAACLKDDAGRRRGARKLVERSLQKLRRVAERTGASCYLGLELEPLSRSIQAYFEGEAQALTLELVDDVSFS